jgi:transposase
MSKLLTVFMSIVLLVGCKGQVSGVSDSGSEYKTISKEQFSKVIQEEEVVQAGFKTFNTISRTIQNHYQTILNYFDNRSTNASAESFNAKIKAFRSQFRGVRNIEFFLYRLTQI